MPPRRQSRDQPYCWRRRETSSVTNWFDPPNDGMMCSGVGRSVGLDLIKDLPGVDAAGLAYEGPYTFRFVAHVTGKTKSSSKVLQRSG